MTYLTRISRNLIRDNPAVYRLFLRLYHGTNLELPDASTDLHLTGYPRSANTFSRHLAKGIFPDLEIITHVHTIASLKAARKYSVPVGVIIRNPVDCVVSMCMKRKKAPTDRAAINEYLYDYIHYHCWLKQHLSSAGYFTFEEVTLHPAIFIQRLAIFLNMPIELNALSERIDVIVSSFADRESTKDPDGSSLPKESRIKRKKQFVENVEIADLLPNALSIYRNLFKKTNILNDG